MIFTDSATAIATFDTFTYITFLSKRKPFRLLIQLIFRLSSFYFSIVLGYGSDANEFETRKYKINRNKKLTATYTLKGMDIDAIIFEIMDYNPI